ncbi:MAG TPA: ribose-phosphate pyrophosphokinase [Anaerohalosphaeraceae bacterium]|nr:ribose-phosphate pyrophosphokinase [Anaerohalosphaeraceae bacterium]HOL88068.1 ribose-phosphate pyrophosphokinase [Anaerohalosphaeraceae bacterium]HPP55316.1 ribose-phosphate pyrophosphokinase [Anaerohalosphaeraceae bacterium]
MIHHPLIVFGGTSHPELTEGICRYLKQEPGKARIWRFPDSEKIIKLETDVRGTDCFVVQSVCEPVDENLVELLIFLDCLRRASAARVTAVIPYFGYARQDRKDEGRVPITAKLVANLIVAAGASRVLTLDLHAAQLQGFFDIPVDHLTAEPVIAKYLKTKRLDKLTVVAPDVGNMKKAARYAQKLGADLAIIHKRRVSGSEIVCGEIIGEVEGRNIVMCDDMITTGGTICGAAELLKQRGAGQIIAGATHGVLAKPAMERLPKAPLDEVIVTDSVPLGAKGTVLKNLTVLSVADLLGEAVRRIHLNLSVSGLFNGTE